MIFVNKRYNNNLLKLILTSNNVVCYVKKMVAEFFCGDYNCNVLKKDLLCSKRPFLSKKNNNDKVK